MRVTEAEYTKMPADLQRLFAKLPNPGSDEVLAVFPSEARSAFPGRPDLAAAYAGALMPLGKNVPYGGSIGGLQYADSGSAARFFYCSKPSTAERDEGLYDWAETSPAEMTGRQEGSAGLSNPRASSTAPRRNSHPTVKSIRLMRWLVRLITPPGGIVLDPFCGSGSTLIAARAEGHRSIGIDLEQAHVDIAWGRMSQGVLDFEEVTATR